VRVGERGACQGYVVVLAKARNPAQASRYKASRNGPTPPKKKITWKWGSAAHEQIWETTVDRSDFC